MLYKNIYYIDSILKSDAELQGEEIFETISKNLYFINAFFVLKNSILCLIVL